MKVMGRARMTGAVVASVVLIRTESGLGSGVVLDGQGNIVTNAHVAGNATKFEVQLSGDPQPRPAARFRYLAPGLAVILGAVAVKLLTADLYEVPAWASPAFIAAVLAVRGAGWPARAAPAPAG